MPKTQHLMQRGQTWYIRLRVPTDLLSEYDGTKEVQRSLKTRDPLSIKYLDAGQLNIWGDHAT